jgi:drug/metabolite transporter (DMT)-like permease
MTPVVVVVVLAAAVLHATWNAIAHAVDDTLAGFVLIDCGYLAGALALIVVSPLPDPAAWPFLLTSAVLQSAYQVCLWQAYRLGDFGQMYPLARGTSPWLVAVLAVTVLGQPLPGGQLAGVLTLSLGLAGLTFAQGLPTRAQLPALAAAVATGVLIAGYTVVDGTGVRHAGTVTGYVGWGFAVQALPLPLVAFAVRGRSLLPRLRPVWGRGVLGGVISLAAYGLVVWAQDTAPGNLPAIAALRETSILLAAAIGAVLFRERFGRGRAVAAAAVVAGIAILELTPK